VALVAVIAILGAACSWVVQRDYEYRNAAQLMDRRTDDLKRAISTELQRYGEILTDVSVALGAESELTESDFLWITKAVSTRQMPGATSLDLVVKTSDAGVAGLQSYWRRRGPSDLTLRPVGTAGMHAFTIFSRSIDGRYRPTGTDLYGAPEAAEALLDSRGIGGFAISRAYVLLADRVLPAEEQQLSFQLAVPVYHAGNLFRGWLTMGVHGHDLLSRTLRAQAPYVAADLFEPHGALTQTVATATADRARHYPHSLDRRARITIGVRTWTLATYPTGGLIHQPQESIAGIRFLALMTITALLTLIVGLLASARNRAMSKVDAATAALRSDIRRREQVETQLRERELELQQIALHDPLTGLANRAGLDARLAETVGRDTHTALLLIDLDGFKQVNDVYGHAAGDTMLTDFGRILRASVRTGDVIGRLGGDEFVVLITDLPDEASAVTTAERILAGAASAAVFLGDDTLTIQASIGVATSHPGDTPQDLMRRADLAMYRAKHLGTHGVQVHDPSMIDQRTTGSPLAEDLAGALERSELHVLYQPLVDLAGGHPVGVEALVRWQHPTLGLVSPTEFIPVAERTGLITEIGLFVLETACRQVAQWADLYASVNLSPRQLQEPTLVRDVLDVLARTGLAPHRLVLEITESALVDDNTGVDMLRQLREHGIRVAIDDFGTGYSSLHYLTRMPVDILKIDRSFVAQLNGTPESSGIAEVILRLSQVLHLTTIAKGIETASQATELQLLGCGIGQGYLFAKPMSSAALIELLETRVNVTEGGKDTLNHPAAATSVRALTEPG
jgi:diguanylate cyclase (GGDEF)-like protein